MSSEGTKPIVRRLPAQATSASEARGLVRRLLVEAGRDDLGEPAALLVSEVVTNALLHAGTPVDLRLSYEHGSLLAQVGDGTPHLPSMRRYGSTSGTGRGLRLLDQMADEWGVTTRAGGKTVWFRLSVADRGIDSPSAAGPGRSGKGDNRDHPGRLAVELRNMPLLLHAAWQEYAETLLREFLLLTIGGADGDASLQVHARATAAIAVLEEHVPRVQVAFDPEQLMQDATEPQVSVDVVHLPVSMAAAHDFDILDRAIERAIGLAGAGMLLTPPSQPEIQEFRRWICAQVREQAAGRPPTAWSMEREPPAEVYLRLVWDAAPVSRGAHRQDRRRRGQPDRRRQPGRPRHPRVRRTRRPDRLPDRRDRARPVPAGSRRRVHDVPAHRPPSADRRTRDGAGAAQGRLRGRDRAARLGASGWPGQTGLRRRPATCLTRGRVGLCSG